MITNKLSDASTEIADVSSNGLLDNLVLLKGSISVLRINQTTAGISLTIAAPDFQDGRANVILVENPGKCHVFSHNGTAWRSIPAGGGGGGGGSVTSVGLVAPSIFNVAGSPVTSSGNLTMTLADQPVNAVLAGPASGLPGPPTFRSLVGADVPLFTDLLAGSVPPSGGGVLSFYVLMELGQCLLAEAEVILQLLLRLMLTFRQICTQMV